jgi:hypothetical protein
MKKLMLVVALVVLPLQAFAGGSVYKLHTNMCGSYKGSWKVEAATKTWRENTTITCTEEKPGYARCVMSTTDTNETWEFLTAKTIEDGVLKYEGFSSESDDMLFQVLCVNTKHCKGFRVWNKQTLIGMQCAYVAG